MAFLPTFYIISRKNLLCKLTIFFFGMANKHLQNKIRYGKLVKELAMRVTDSK